MSERIYGYSTNKIYEAKNAFRIINPKQLLFYLEKGVELYDVYPSEDLKDPNKKILVYIVDKKASRKFYDEWELRKNDSK